MFPLQSALDSKADNRTQPFYAPPYTKCRQQHKCHMALAVRTKLHQFHSRRAPDDRLDLQATINVTVSL